MNYFIWKLAGPETWPFWLILIATAGYLRGTRRATSMARSSVILAATLVLAGGVMPTGYWLMEHLEAKYPRPSNVPQPVTDIVVLAGAESLEVSRASGALEMNRHGDRITEAVALANIFANARLWIVGGLSKGGKMRDIDWTADYWKRAGVEASRIHKIGGTHDTCGNAVGIREVLNGSQILLVTSAFHMPRAMACMKFAGVRAIPYPVDRQVWFTSNWRGTFTAGFSENLQRTDLALHEYLGLAYYQLAGRIDGL